MTPISFLRVLALCAFFSFTQELQAQQTLTQVNSWNAYVHLPATYNSNTGSYPTIIYFPGLGNVGTRANLAISQGPGAYISRGWNGNVVVDGTTVEFIVISLQPSSAYPTEPTINQRIQTLKSQYRIDPNRLYLTGFSHGGWCSSTFVSGDPYGGPYTYATQVAAVVTVEGVIPDDNQPYPALFDNFAVNGGKYLGFEQLNDNRDTRTVVDRMNATVPNSAIYMQTNFGSGGHCCPEQFYGGSGVSTPVNFMLGGINQNIYQWMARQSLNNSIPANVPPVANAGSDQSITLPANSVTLNGSGTDADGTIAGYQWRKISGPVSGTITNSTSANTTVTGLVQGAYLFELKVTDNNGATATDNIQITVQAAVANQPPVANAGADQNIILPVNSVALNGSGTDNDGTITAYSWSKISGPPSGTISNSSTAHATAQGLVEGVYIFQLAVTDDDGAQGSDAVQVTVSGETTSGNNFIRVNIFAGNNPFTDPAWNNWNVAEGIASNNFKYESGASSTINAMLNTNGGIADNGAAYAVNATACPGEVLRYNSYNTSIRTLSLSGLNPSKSYYLEFYGSRANSGNSTVVTIGNMNDTISTDNNTSDYAKFYNISPQANGNLDIYLSRIGTYNYIAGFMIKEEIAGRASYISDAIPVNNAMENKMQILPLSEPDILIYPNPFNDRLQVKIANWTEPDNMMYLTDLSGRLIWKKKINIAKEHETGINTYGLKPGMYLLIIQNKNGEVVRKVIRK